MRSLPALSKINLKLITLVTLLVMLFGGFVAINNTFAQSVDGIGGNVSVDGIGGNVSVDGIGGNVSVDGAAAGGTTVNGTTQDTGAGSGSVGDTLAIVWNFVSKLLYIFFVAIPVLIASLTGQLMNTAITELVIGMGQLINHSTGIGFAINKLWEVIRDVMNILFIFALVFLGIKIILNSDDSGTRRALGLLIAAALLINFSLLITKTIIDFSNIMAVEIYEILGGPTNDGFSFTSVGGITGAFFNATGVQEIVTGSQSLNTTGETTWETVIQQGLMMFMTMILFIVFTVVFMGGAAMLFVRFIALILYMIFSPVMFLGWILPAWKKHSDKWWNGFFKQAFFAPAFLFMLYISLITTTQLRAGIGGGVATTAQYQAAVEGSGDAFTIFIVYVFAIGMLIASIIVAQSMGVAGASTTIGALQGMRKGVQGLLYRKTVGAGMNQAIRLRDNIDRRLANEKEANKNRRWYNPVKHISNVGRGALNVATLGTLQNERVRASMERTRDYGAGGVGYSAAEKDEKTRKTRIASDNQKVKLKDLIAKYQKDGIETPELREALSGARLEFLEKLSDAERADIAHLFSSSQMDSLNKSTELNDTQKSNLGTARRQKLQELFTENGRVIGDNLSKATLSQLETLSEEFIMENAHLFTDSQMQDFKKSKKFTEDQVNRFNAKRNETIERFINTGGAAGARQIFENTTKVERNGRTVIDYKVKKPKEIAKLPKVALMSMSALPYMTGGVLEEIFDQKTLTPEERSQLRRRIMAPGSNAPQDAIDYLNSPLGRRNWQ